MEKTSLKYRKERKKGLEEPYKESALRLICLREIDCCVSHLAEKLQTRPFNNQASQGFVCDCIVKLHMYWSGISY